MLLLNISDKTGLIILLIIIGIMIGPSIILVIIGLSIRKHSPNSAKILFILSGAYLVIAGGMCGSILLGG